ncbi:protein GID8 homolog [Hibiscus syriacus]|uniref:protein GID8 homolog n=1 Tax=Hibiscus syriacus TaxID=106335 RepID=UPI001921CEBD|nr:protein GID8 homolog [Hibiscus syriacus]
MESGTELVVDPATITARMAVKRAVLCGNLEEAINKGSFYEEIERTVSLLAFEDVSNCPEGRLMDESRCLKLASDANVAILSCQNLGKDPQGLMALKMPMWAQIQLEERAAYTRINNLWSARLDDPQLDWLYGRV